VLIILTDFYNIWHRVYKIISNIKVIDFSPQLYLILLHYPGVNNFGCCFLRCMGDSKKSVFWCWDDDTDLEVDPYCKWLKWPPLALRSRRQSRIHLLARGRASSHGELYAGLTASDLFLVHWEVSLAPISQHLNPLDYHIWGAMLDVPWTQSRPKSIDELKVALQEEPPQNRSIRRRHNSPSPWLHTLLPMLATSGICSKNPFQFCNPHLDTNNRLISEPPTYRRKQLTKCSKLVINFFPR